MNRWQKVKSGDHKIYLMNVLLGVMILLGGCGGGGGDGDGGGNESHEAVRESDGSDDVYPDSAEIATQRATLNWKAPETRVNGDVLGRYDVASYEIRYGKDAARLDSSVVVDGVAGLYDLSFTIYNLSNGTWYFTIQARDDDGLLSSPSEVVNKSVAG